MAEEFNPYYGSFERPDSKGISLQKTKTTKSKKRALQDRLYDESPTKKSKRTPPAKAKRRPFGAQPPPPDDVTNEDSSLMDLFNMKYPTSTTSTTTTPCSNPPSGTSLFNNGEQTPSSLSARSTSPSPSPSSTSNPSSMSPLRHSIYSNSLSSSSPVTLNNNHNHNHNQNQNSLNSSSVQIQLNSITGQKAPVPQTHSYMDFIQTPPQSKTKKRQRLTPAPLTTSSPSWPLGTNPPMTIDRGVGVGVGMRGNGNGNGPGARMNLQGRFAEEADSEWSINPCLDWSLKTRLTLISTKSFGWNSTGLKCSEESSGTSAFARCIDIDPDPIGSGSSKNKNMSCGNGMEGQGQGQGTLESGSGSQLDTSLGAQFHRCCLYWQHPSFPSATLFPREGTSSGSGGLSFNPARILPMGGIRFDQKVIDCMLTDWVEAFRSVFQLVRTRQCPYFYACANQFTALFCAAGTQGLDCLQVYVTPSTKGFRESLKAEGIEFSTPCAREEKESKESKEDDKNNKKSSCNSDEKEEAEVESDDEEPDKWLNDMGISQDVSVNLHLKSSPATLADEKNKSTLVLIAGVHTLAFFNFLINSKNLLVASIGPFSGVPPTVLAPVAFHGATLRQLQVKQNKGKTATGELNHTIEMIGPILPHVIHMLCPLLGKTVQDFKISTTTLTSTVNLNLNSRVRSGSNRNEGNGKTMANAFELQNLSDCGLNKSMVEMFCKPDSIDTVSSQIECQNGMYKWS